MEPILLATAALSILSPYIKKTGEKFAEKIGEGVWTWITKALSNKKEPKLPSSDGKGEEELKAVLLNKINSDNQFKVQLEEVIQKAQSDLAIHYEQYIENHGAVEKQINITHNTGNITM